MSLELYARLRLDPAAWICHVEVRLEYRHVHVYVYVCLELKGREDIVEASMRWCGCLKGLTLKASAAAM
jgi:hypothetical protein